MYEVLYYAIINQKGGVMMKKDKLVIRKSNAIVRNTINKFNYKQNQLMCLLLGKYVNLSTNECISTEISIDELRKTLGLTDGKKNYETIRHAIDKFGENGSVGIYDSDRNKYIWMPYFTKIELDDTKVLFKWNDEMKPNLINLKNKYTQYLASDYLNLSSIYSQNLYEQLKSIENWNQEIIFSIADLHRIFQTENKKTYQSFNSLKNKILLSSVEEINTKTDLDVSMSTVKDNHDKRKVYGVKFEVKKKRVKQEPKSSVPDDEPIEGQTTIDDYLEESSCKTNIELDTLKGITNNEFNESELELLDNLVMFYSNDYNKRADYLKSQYLIMNLKKPRNRFNYLKKMIENDIADREVEEEHDIINDIENETVPQPTIEQDELAELLDRLKKGEL